MEEEKKICIPYHTVNGYVPQGKDLQLDGQVCECGKIKFVKVNTCGCPAATAVYELQSSPNE